MTKGLSEKTEAIRAEVELEIGCTFGCLLAARGKTRSPSCDRREAARAPAARGELPARFGEEEETETSTPAIRPRSLHSGCLESGKLVALGGGTATRCRVKLVRTPNRGAFARVQRLLNQDASQPLNRERERKPRSIEFARMI